MREYIELERNAQVGPARIVLYNTHGTVLRVLRKLVSVFFVVTMFFFASQAQAVQDVYNVFITGVTMDANTHICTIGINASHANTRWTQTCNQGFFSWDCTPNDYNFQLAQQALRDGRPVNIRYSEQKCHSTGNMLFLQFR